jgi:hypothetical protein
VTKRGDNGENKDATKTNTTNKHTAYCSTPAGWYIHPGYSSSYRHSHLPDVQQYDSEASQFSIWRIGWHHTGSAG